MQAPEARRDQPKSLPLVWVLSTGGTTATGNGRVTGRKVYDDLGMIPTDNLSLQKARILLMLALTKTKDPREIARIFSEY